MLLYNFSILFAMCVPSVLESNLGTSTHIITFRFGQCPDLDVNLMKKIEVIMMKKGFGVFRIPVNFIFLTEKNKTLNIVIDDLFDKKKSLNKTYQISFFNSIDNKIFEGAFAFEKSEDGTLTMYTTKSRKYVESLTSVYHNYLLRLFNKDKSFSIVPKSSVLITKDFVKIHKNCLTRYFNRHRGLKETVDCLNDCLSQIKEEGDIPVQLKKFIDGRRSNLHTLNECSCKMEALRNCCFNVEYELANLLFDVLKFMEIYTKLGSDLNPNFFISDQNIYTAIKEVKTFYLPNSVINDEKNEIKLELYPEGDIDLPYGKDIWFYGKKLYVSLDFCTTCKTKSYSLKAFNFKETDKFIALELYSA